MLSDIFNNPEIIRNIRYRLRPKTIILTIILTMALLLLIARLVLAIENLSFTNTERWGTLFLIYAWSALSIGCIYAVFLTHTSVIGEKDKKTYDYLFMTPLSNRTIAIGKLIGSTVHLWFIIAIIGIFLLISGLAGEVNGVKLITFFLILITGLLACAALGLLVSVSINKMISSIVGIVIILGIYFSSIAFVQLGKGDVPYLKFYSLLTPFSVVSDITSSMRTSHFEHFENIISFFGFNINGGWMTIFLYAWLIYWMMRAVTRKIRNLQGVYLTQIETIIFFAVFEILLMGFQWEYIKIERYFWPSLITYLLTNSFIFLALSSGLSINRNNYFAYVRGKVTNAPFKLLGGRTPPHLLHIILFLIFIIGIFIMTPTTLTGSNPILIEPEDGETFISPMTLIIWLYIWVIIASISIFYILTQILKTIFIRSGTLISFLISASAFFIPVIVIGVFRLGDQYERRWNQISYITETHTSFVKHDFGSVDLLFHPILLAVILAIMLCLFIWRHYTIKRIIRHRMNL